MATKSHPSDVVLRKRFGLWLKARREEIGLTQLDMTAALDYGYTSTVSQVERGVTALPAASLLKWAELLRVERAEFAKLYLYYYEPYVHLALYGGKSPYETEKLPHADSTVSPPPRPRKKVSEDR